MDLNYAAFFLIAFVPLLLGYGYYHPQSPMRKRYGFPRTTKLDFSLKQMIILFILSLLFVYGYINVVIHQLGFYELFFTDIMKGNQESEKIVAEFLATYGEKHRHFGHGLLHGLINAFIFVLPILGGHVILEEKSAQYFWFHFLFGLITSIIVGGLISAFV